jgi:hypothetical protein
MKLTRRQLPGALASVGALASAVARAQAPAPPASPEAELQSARDQVKAIGLALTQHEVPMSTEPAFAFQA